MCHALHHAKGATHRGRADPLHARALIGEALCDKQPIDVSAEARLLLRVGDRRTQKLFDVLRDDLPRERASTLPAMTRHIVATVDEIAPGTSKVVTVNGREVGVFNVDGERYKPGDSDFDFVMM